ncbi:flavin reductase family protein [Desulfoprunum benzoelyticum]|uniref:Flavin reductase (DIM6/NTAB) family NADH-FMN oxidoreductase RutF n=1 Tax=Desulfoprunum benzoelyticum TaxID=1506996 RepID=A0A840UTF1_9BACT|nr:flavin reductase family protein [Desulfoprunum benzoelyticum]MBB5346654.1 flavin reductase (DIM6/NTAB) family NADH-FMN oxidoreductase RutF [Desulfoprunum benzoelyticum]MBM9529101.1 flavin reductase family protein [Desulfoprunum benzoelyticum]
MNERNYLHLTDQLFDQIKRGAFLTVRAGDAVNTMTIGWATIGWIWQKPILMVAVRDSRHTFTLLETIDNFTVTIPTGGGCAKALTLCGTKSGRDMDKLAASGLQLKQARTTESPVIDVAGVHYECRIVYKSAMDSAFLHPELDKLYPQQDFHTLYFGEILNCYETE